MLEGYQKLLAKSSEIWFFSLGFFFKYCGSFQDVMGRWHYVFYSYLCCTQCDGQGFKPTWAEL